MPHRHPRRPRRLARQAHAALRPRPRGHRHHREAGRERHEPDRRRARLHRLARLSVRRVPLLHRRSRDPVRAAAKQRLLDRRSVRRIRRRQRDLRRPRARRHQLDRRRALELRGCDDLQGSQGRPGQADRAGRDLRHRRPRATWPSSTPGSWAGPWLPSTSSNPSSTSPRNSAPSTSSTLSTVDPVVALQDLGGLDVAVVLAASPRVFEQAFASLRRGGRLVCVALPADGGAMDHPHLRDRAQGHLDHRVHRRHPPGPRGGLRTPRGRQDPGDSRDQEPRRRQRAPSPRCSPARSRLDSSSTLSRSLRRYEAASPGEGSGPDEHLARWLTVLMTPKSRPHAGSLRRPFGFRPSV